MGFVTGLGVPTGMGVPTYYIQGINPPNTWDANTWVNIYFDNSGSMNDIITPLKNVMIGDYCASGSAAGGDCVKATDNLRAELQDLYATGGTEESGNADNATNGKDAYDARIIWNERSGERWLQWVHTRSTTNNNATTQTWKQFGDANTVSNVVQIVVLNESKGTNSAPLYHRTQFGAPHTATVTAVVDGATSNSTAVTFVDGDPLVKGHDGGVHSDASTNMTITAVSSGSFVSGTSITAISGNDITLSQANTFADGITVTFQITAYGWDAEGDTGSPDNHANFRTDMDAYRGGLNTGVSGFKGVNDSGQKPSLSLVIIDSGLDDQFVSGYQALQASSTEPKADAGNGGIDSNRTANQRLLQEGIIEGSGEFLLTRSDANNYSLSDFNDLPGSGTGVLAWNEKQNLISTVLLEGQNQNTSQSFWFTQLRNALLANITF